MNKRAKENFKRDMTKAIKEAATKSISNNLRKRFKELGMVIDEDKKNIYKKKED